MRRCQPFNVGELEGGGGWGAQIEVWARSEENFRLWDGWVHSRLRQLVMRVEPFVLVRPWPKARPGASPRRGLALWPGAGACMEPSVLERPGQAVPAPAAGGAQR